MNNGKAVPDYDFAISFAGNDRSIAERLFSLLNAGGAVAFIDSQFRAKLLGRPLDKDFAWVFGPGTKFFIPIVSRSYAERSWPKYEWDVAISEAKKRDPKEFILPLRLDDTLLIDLPSTIGYIDLRKHSIEDAAGILLEKLTGQKKMEIVHWVATFGLLIDNVMKNPPPTAPTYYPHLCDWLAEDLLTRLKNSLILNTRIVDDSRDGESFSVRIAFEWNPREAPLDFGVLDWWQVLEVLPYDKVFRESY
jgi:hypothetical protein